MIKIKQFLAVVLLLTMHNLSAQDILGPTGALINGAVTVLPNGNFVVVETTYNEGATLGVGAVYLFNGATKTIISILKGSTTNDGIGNGGITVLTNGNYVVSSTTWDNGTVADAGAATLCSATTGLSGVVSTSNSLVGSTASDSVGSVFALTNGNYVVTSTNWDNGAVANAGAVTWCNGTTGRTGTVSTSNSLVGSTASDQIGGGGITALTNGNYVVSSFNWDNGAVTNAGAVTWCDGTTGRTGTVSTSNSLVGSTAVDQIGTTITTLTNGNYIVRSGSWDNGAVINAGAVTWCDGTTGRTGTISSSNSLVGSTANDNIGVVTALTSGNYIVTSTTWDNGAATDAGAVTWGSGTTGVKGIISSSNSLIGTTTLDSNGMTTVVLTNGNYLVRCPRWDNGAIVDAGAVTWGNGTTGINGVRTSSNSLVGTVASDLVGSNGAVALTNGNYVVVTSSWDNGAVVNVGAITWCNGSTGRTGTITSSNSLIGSVANDSLGNNTISITALSNGNYVVTSISWDNGAVTDAGAITWCNGTAVRTGTVSASNSLVGSKASEALGTHGVTALTNGNYVVLCRTWSNGAVASVGAVTWGDGTTGTAGVVSTSNSLVGSTANDNIGFGGVFALTNGNYVVSSSLWDNGTTVNAGASTWCDGTTGRIGTVSASNSLVGNVANDSVGGTVFPLTNGNYVVRSTACSNGAIAPAGAMTYGNGTSGTTGPVSDCNSVFGEVSTDILNMTYNAVYDYLLIAKLKTKKINISNRLVENIPTVSIISSDADNNITLGTSVTFTATAANSGTTPSYQWKVNGTNAGTNSATFTTTTLAHNDSVTVVVTSNYACSSPTTATSNAIVTKVLGISSFTPTSAASGTVVTITGTNFTGATAVSFGGTAATSFTEVSSTQITATVASGTSGSVSVTTPVGTVTKAGFIFIPNTQIQAAFNNTTVALLNTPIYVDTVVGAEAYMYKVVNGSFSYEKERTGTNMGYFNFSQIPGITFSSTYMVTVKVKMGGVYGNYGTAVSINSPNNTALTKLETSSCGITISTLGQRLYATPVLGAVSYRFEVTKLGTTNYYTTSNNYFTLTNIGGGQLGTIYSIKVATLGNGNSTYGSFGDACTVTTPTPITKVRSTQCGITLATVSTPVCADLVSGATNYTFEITYNGTIYNFESGYNFKLRSVNGLPLLTNSVYAIRVKVKINGVYGTYGASCNVTTPATRDGEFDEEFTDFTVASYPNPFAGTFQLDLKSTSNSEINVMVYDMLGKQIENRTFNALAIYNQEFGANYASGIYNVLVTQNGTTKTVRVIKN